MGVYSVPLAGGPFRKLLDFSHRRLAVASHYGDPREDMLLYVLDLERGTVETSPLREPGGRDPWAAGVRVLRFESDGSVLAAGEGGVRRWRPGRPLERILGGPGVYAVFDGSRDGRTLAVLEGRFHLGPSTLSEARITLLDLATGARRSIATHGNTLLRMIATDSQGRVIVTGDAQGTVRVGLASGEPPHLLLGHERPVRALAVSPDGRWVVSAAGSDIRLWPMPNLSRPPFHIAAPRRAPRQASRTHQPRARRGPGVARRLPDGDRPVPRLAGRAELVRGRLLTTRSTIDTV